MTPALVKAAAKINYIRIGIVYGTEVAANWFI